MEAATLMKKKNNFSKGKIKKSLRSVLCRPDPTFWPELSEEHGKKIESALKNYKVAIPEYKKPHWKEIKLIPKNERQKSPKILKREGLIFGITEVTTAVQSKQCAAIIIESSVNPRTLILPLIEQCFDSEIPTLCLNGLRKITSANFGIPTSCLGIKCDQLTDLIEKVCELAKHYKPSVNFKISTATKDTIDIENMQVDENIPTVPKSCPYLYRTSKRIRIFNPSKIEPKSKKAFIGQDFIEFSDKPAQETGSKAYMNMILKKISNNQNRVKRK